MDKITPEALITFLWVAAALIAFTLSVWALLDKIRKARQPKLDLERWQMETEQRLDKGKKRIDSLEEGNVVLCKAILAMLNHEITGNSVERLKQAQQELQNYLVER